MPVAVAHRCWARFRLGTFGTALRGVARRATWARVVVVVMLIAVSGCSSGDNSESNDERSGGTGGIPDAIPAAGETTAGSFLDLNGWMWFYTTADEIGFTDITAMLDDLHDRGIRVIGIYSPYDGDVEKWLGCIARDFYSTAPQSGTVEDFTAMVDGAHDRGMKVVTYFSSLGMDDESEFFRTAEQQYADGDRTSREVSAFHWVEDDSAPLPTPATGPSEWEFSEVAGAYYWSLWGGAGFDLDLPGARAEVIRAERFWLDTGIDGFMWDAAFVDPEFRQVLVDLPVAHSPSDKWLTFEVTYAEEADSYVDFGLTSWFNLEDNDEENDYSLVAAGDASVEDVEEALAIAEEAHDDGKLTHAWSPWEPDAYGDTRMRVQEAALLAGGGIAYGAASYTGYQDWPQDVRAAWERVLMTTNTNPALLPSAHRTRLPAGDDGNAYAMYATADDDSQTALLVYNLGGQPATVTVDLAGSGIATDQVPVDLYRDQPAAPIDGTTYAVDLPTYGFALLQVNVD